MPPYKEAFPAGSMITVRDKDFLERFKRDWKYHHPLTDHQLTFAGKSDRVVGVGFYHGGDALYKLETTPGLWHEECLQSSSPSLKQNQQVN
jgi:hypothetical protein